MKMFKDGTRKKFIIALSTVVLLAQSLLTSVAPAYAAPSLLTLDSTGTVGTYTSIAIGSDGFPVMSYYDQTNSHLKLFHCGNAACTSGNAAVTVDTNANTGQWNSLAIGTDGFPIISYYDASIGLRVAHCGNAACSSGNTITTLDSTGTTGRFTSIKIGADNKPVISYYDFTNTNLKVAHCGNTACSSGNTNTTADSSGYDGSNSSMAIGTDGFPVISHFESNSNDLRIMHCGNAACTSGNTATAVDTSGLVGSDDAIAIGSDGYPIVSYYDISNANLKVMHCGNAACSSGNTFTSPDTGGDVGSYTSIAIGTDNKPVISYYDTTNHDLKALHCGNAGCTSGNVITTLDSSGDVGKYTSIVIGGGTFPVISYYDTTNTDLKLALCDTQDCAPSPDADIYVTKSIDNADPKEGDTVVYTVTVGNSGPAAATNVAVTDLLPSGLTYVSDTPSQGSYVSGTGIWTVGSIANGGSKTLAITATVDAGTNGNLITNTADVTASDQPDGNVTNDSASVAKTIGLHTQSPTLQNSVVLDRLKAGASGSIDFQFDLQNTLTGTLTITFPSVFTINSAATAGNCSGGGTLDTFGFNNGTHKLTAEKHACSGTVTLTGANVTNPIAPGAYFISWVNDDPGGATIIITADDAIDVTAAVDPYITFHVVASTAPCSHGTDGSSTDHSPTGDGGTVALGALTSVSVGSSDALGVNHICTFVTTNAPSGYGLTVTSQYGQLQSLVTPADAIPAAPQSNGSVTAVGGTAAYALCLSTADAPNSDMTDPTGTNLTGTSPFAPGTCVGSNASASAGKLTTSTQAIGSNGSGVQDGAATWLIKASINAVTPVHDDYQDTLTFIATGTF